VSIDDERALKEQLDRAFDAITPRPTPVEGVIRRGKVMRARRRAAVAVGLAGVVAAGVFGIPALAHRSAAPVPATPGRYTVTVQEPGPHSPAGLIASGTVNGKRWQVTASRPGTEGANRSQQFVMASGPAFAPDGLNSLMDRLAPDSTAPISFQGFDAGPNQGHFGPVRADVSYAKVRLSNGAVLTLRPVTVYGIRLVAFAAPEGAVIVDVTAYSRHGEIATATPFDVAGGLANFAAWLKPGQRGLPRVTGRIGSGTFDGSAWSAVAYQGPWGFCVKVNGGGSCMATTTSGRVTGEMFLTAGSPGVFTGTASASVVRVFVERPDGTTFWVRPVTVGTQRLFAFPLSPGHKPWRWTAYDNSGHVVASSQVTPIP
jgi:hypothetical protein